MCNITGDGDHNIFGYFGTIWHQTTFHQWLDVWMDGWNDELIYG